MTNTATLTYLDFDCLTLEALDDLYGATRALREQGVTGRVIDDLTDALRTLLVRLWPGDVDAGQVFADALLTYLSTHLDDEVTDAVMAVFPA